MAKSRRSEQEWLALIHECKASGYTDTEWCRQNNIPLSSFYYKLNSLREKSSFHEITKPIIQDQQEVVEVKLQRTSREILEPIKNEVAIRLDIHGITVEILKNADKSIIENTMQSLRLLC